MVTSSWRETKVVFKYKKKKMKLNQMKVEEKQKLYLNISGSPTRSGFKNRWRETKVVFK